jgi:hypothetical protein
LYAARDSANSSLIPDWQDDIVDTHYVPVVSLDIAIKTFGKPFFCKIDVEGWELEVLKGLTQPIPLISLEFHLSERDIAKTLSCLRRLSAFGSHFVNVAPAEASFFQFQEWKHLDEFMEWFPGNLRSTLPRYSYGGYSYGDLFVMQAGDEPRHYGPATTQAETARPTIRSDRKSPAPRDLSEETRLGP